MAWAASPARKGVEGLGIMGYSTEEKAYVSRGVDNSPMTWASVPRGTFADGVRE